MPRPPKITNEEILVAARQVFLEQGESGSTLEIAEKAGISEAHPSMSNFYLVRHRQPRFARN
jgi:Bacterial regulatory proteins, tetR family